MTEAKATVTTVGIPRDKAGHDRRMALYDAIDNGDHDDRLNTIEINAKKRRTMDRRGQQRLPADRLVGTDLLVQIINGYYSAGYDGMALILEAVRNRKIDLKNAELRAKQAELAAAAPTVKAGDPVRIRLDAPIAKSGEVLLGKTGTIKRVLQKNATIDFDPGQALGRFAGGAKIPIAWLELNDAQSVDDRAAEILAEPATPALTAEEVAYLADLVEADRERVFREIGDDTRSDDEIEAADAKLADLKQRLTRAAGLEAKGG